MPYSKGFEVTRFVGLGMALGAVFIAAGAGNANRANDNKAETSGEKFHVVTPDLSKLQPCSAAEPDPCDEEAAALAAALAALDAARATAEAMYDAYVDCLDQNGGGPSPEPIDPNGPIDPRPAPRLAGSVSILTK